MSLYLEEKRSLIAEFNDIPLQQKQSMYRNVRSIVAMLVKVSKMTEIYSVQDKVFDDFNENMLQNLNLIFNSLPFFSITTKKVGFYYQEKKIKLFDEGERKFRSVFLVNEIRELYFRKGVSSKEIRSFFEVLARILNYTGMDYDFNSLLWDFGITHIGTVSDPDMGDPEFFDEKLFTLPEIFAESTEFDDQQVGDLLPIIPVANPSDFNEFLERRGSGFVLGQYLQVVEESVLKNPDSKESATMIHRITSFPFDLLKEGEIAYAMAFLHTVLSLTKRFPKKDSTLYDRLMSTSHKLGEERFITDIFDLVPLLKENQYHSFAELVHLMGSHHFETVFSLLVEVPIKEVRLLSLPGLAKYFTGMELAERFFKDSDWHIVRNALTLLTHNYNPHYLDYVRELMTHESPQVRLEAARVLSDYDADENLPYWQVAINSPDDEVRDLAMLNLVKVRGFEGKQVMNAVFTQEGFEKYGIDAFKRFVSIIINSGRRELFDLPVNLLSHENKELRFAVLSALNAIEDPHMIYSQISRQLRFEYLSRKDVDEIKLLLQLVRGEQELTMLKNLEYIFTLKGPFFHPSKYKEFKKTVLMTLVNRAGRSKALTAWLLEGKKRGDKETREILAYFQG